MTLEHMRILVATDGSEYAKKGLDYAVSLASISGGEIILLHVIPYAPDPTTSFWTSPVVEVMDRKYLDELRKDAERLIEEEKKRLEREIERIPHEIKVTSLIEFGEPAEKILEIAEKTKADLIVMGVRGKSSWKKIILGSVSDKVLDRAKIPVMIIR